MSGIPAEFDAATQKELQAFLQQEQAKATLQTSIHTFTDMCWDKCIQSAGQARFSRGEQTCLVNCVGRFLDTSLYIVESLKKKQGGQ